MTTDKSRADALTDLLPCPHCGHAAQIMMGTGPFGGRVQVECASCRIATFWFEEAVAVRMWNRRVAASPVEQPAAAPIGDSEARRLASQLRMVCDEQGCRFNACEEAADYLEAFVAVPAPSQAFEAWARGKGGYTAKELEVFNGQYVDEHANTALDAWLATRDASASQPVDERAAFNSEVGSVVADAATRGIAWMAFKAGAVFARAASANEAAEAVAIPAGKFASLFDFHADFSTRGERFLSAHGARAFADAVLTAAPQPAQADARVGLTDEQREAIDFVIGWYEQSTIADNPYREHIAALRALLQGANHAE